MSRTFRQCPDQRRRIVTKLIKRGDSGGQADRRPGEHVEDSSNLPSSNNLTQCSIAAAEIFSIRAERKFPLAAIAKHVCRMKTQQMFIDMTIAAGTVATKEQLRVAFEIAECAAQSVVAEQAPSARQALIRIDLQGMVRGIREITHEVSSPKLRIDDDEVLGQTGEPQQCSAIATHADAIEEVGKLADFVIRKHDAGG